MGYKSGDQELLNAIAERMAGIVDPALRQRLTGLYLGLLTEYNNRRMGPNFHGRVSDLWTQVRAGLTQYRLWPGLGTVHGEFYDALDSALGVMDRLDRLVAMQRDPEKRRRWAGEVQDFRFMLDRLADDAQRASTNVNLAFLDALASQAAGITATHLVPRMVQWGREVRLAVPALVPSGQRAVTTLATRPDQIYRPEGLGEAAEGFLKLAQIRGMGTGGGGRALREAGTVYARYKRAVLRSKGLAARHALQARKVAALQARRDERAPKLSADLAERERNLASVQANLRDVAGRLKTVTYDTFDTPLTHLRQELGVLTEQKGAAILLYNPQITAAEKALTTLESEAGLADGDLPGSDGEGRAAALFGLGLGALALLG